ncbi:hypothetical protein BJX63DRAFT_431237, partial [Aspergillus granulosus]
MIHYGAIASGNQVMRSGTARDKIAQQLDVICFEMEAAGLMDVLPCLPIRGICDYSDSHKSKEWQKYAAAVAAAYARELLEELPVSTGQARGTRMSDSYQYLSQERRQRLLDSLRFKQIDSRKFTIKAAHAKTCRWFLNHPDYQAWLDPSELRQHHGFLWVSGKPGAGKSTIMKFAYSSMKRKSRGKNAVIASFFFNARGEYLEKSVFGMYRSLLLQLLEGYPDLQAILDDPDLVSHSQDDCPSLNVLKNLFCNAVFALGQRVFTCFIDALDECDEQQVVDMVQYFEELADQCTDKGILLRISFSSRHYPHIDIRRGIRLTLEDQPGHAEDMATYITSRLQIRDPTLAEELKPQLLGKAAGVFIWVVLVVEILNKESRRGGLALRKRLSEIPSDLSELFKDILRRDTDNMEDLLLCILWILYAKRPLQPREFYHALWSGLSQKGLADPQIPDVTIPNAADNAHRYVISSSKGLAEITKSEQPTVQFIHESVRDFLIKDNGLHELWPDSGFDLESPGHEILKQCCNFYMNHTLVRASIDEMLSEEKSNEKMDIAEYPFLEYAGQHVLYHANAAAEGVSQREFLSRFPVPHCVKVVNLFEKFRIRRHSMDTNLYYLLAERGFSELIRTRLKDELNVHVFGEKDRHRYPLFAALANCNRCTVAALLNLDSSIYNGIDITEGLNHMKDLQNYKDRTPLSWAAQEGRVVIVELLLRSCTSLSDMDHGGRTPLSRASENGHEEVVKLLLDRGADVNISDKDGGKPILLASKSGQEGVVKLLLETGKVDPDSKVSRLGLSWAAKNGHEAVVKLLLETGKVDPDSKDSGGWTPLLWAAINGREAVAKLLLETGK